MRTLTHLSLFSGIGGIDLAAEWAGFRTVGQVERDSYARRILELRFGNIPRWADIYNLSADDFRRQTGINSPTLISGGFPCQPFSCAGKRRGKEDDRYLWPEMFRIVHELRPAWVLGENVAGIVNMALDDCCADLGGEGYTVRAFIVPACGVGAWHRRNRVFIVACNTDIRREPNMSFNDETQFVPEPIPDTDNGKEPRQQQHGRKMLSPQEVGPRAGSSAVHNADDARSGTTQFRNNWYRKKNDKERKRFPQPESCSRCETLPNSNKPRSQGYRRQHQERECPSKWSSWAGREPLEGIWESEPDVGRVAHGVSHRVDRLLCLGKAVVPQQVYPILAGIAQIETGLMKKYMWRLNVKNPEDTHHIHDLHFRGLIQHNGHIMEKWECVTCGEIHIMSHSESGGSE